MSVAGRDDDRPGFLLRQFGEIIMKMFIRHGISIKSVQIMANIILKTKIFYILIWGDLIWGRTHLTGCLVNR